MSSLVLAPPQIEQDRPRAPVVVRPKRRMKASYLVLATIGSILVHGYHPYSEDAAIYVQAIKKKLDPSLYLRGTEFFLPHTRFSLFPALAALAIRLTHLPVGYGLLLWHAVTVALLLTACWRLCAICLKESDAPLWGMLLVGAALTAPVAGTSLLMFDPYLTARSLSTPALLFALGYLLEDKRMAALLWFALALAAHPLMAAYSGVFFVGLVVARRGYWRPLLWVGIPATAVLLLAARAYGRHLVVSVSWREAILTRSYFFLNQWEWYEIFGLVAPLGLLAWLLWVRRAHPRGKLEECAGAALVFGAFFLMVGVAVIRTPQFLGLARYQPLRSFHLIYLLMILLPVNYAVQRWLGRRPMVFALLLGVIGGSMWFTERQSFPASRHLEWPWAHVQDNSWHRAFDWIRANTPKDAVFALDSQYMDEPGEDHLGFRAYAERNALADKSKDGGVAAIFPPIADAWREQMTATTGLERIRTEAEGAPVKSMGATWMVIHADASANFDCPYRNNTLAVCRLR